MGTSSSDSTRECNKEATRCARKLQMQSGSGQSKKVWSRSPARNIMAFGLRCVKNEQDRTNVLKNIQIRSQKRVFDSLFWGPCWARREPMIAHSHLGPLFVIYHSTKIMLLFIPYLVSGLTAVITTSLSFVGFTMSGIAAGSIAAWVQSILYAGAIPAGGFFALMQSIGMTGALGTAGLVSGGTALAGTLVFVSKIATTAYYATIPLIRLYAPLVTRQEYWNWLHGVFRGETSETLNDMMCRVANYCT